MLAISLPGEAGVDLSCKEVNSSGAAVGCAPVKQDNPILPATAELVFGIISFGVLLILMIKFGMPAITKAMNARSDKIAGDLDSAESAKTEAVAVLVQYKAQLADAKAESNRIIEEARATAEKMKSDIVGAAQVEVTDLKTKATADIDAARAQAMASIQGSIGGLVIELAEKVVERNLDKDTNTALINSFIAKVGS